MNTRLNLAKLLLALIVWGSLFGVPSASMSEITNADDSSLEQIVEQVIAHLSSEPQFESWRNASWIKHPLGPGTHQWLILLKSPHGKEVGYLVLNAVEDGGWQVQEYGTGPYPLFHSQAWEEADRYYFHEFETVWAVPSTNGEIEYIDGVTNESYPAEWVEKSLLDLSEDMAPTYNPDLPLFIDMEQEYTLISQTTAALFDPYERMSWLVAEPVALDTIFDADHQYVYVSNIFDQNIHIPWAVTGHHKWKDDHKTNQTYTFLQIEMDDITRFIPAPTFQQYGEFYPVL